MNVIVKLNRSDRKWVALDRTASNNAEKALANSTVKKRANGMQAYMSVRSSVEFSSDASFSGNIRSQKRIGLDGDIKQEYGENGISE